MAEQIQRQIAHKVWIQDLYGGKYIKQEGWNPNYVLLGETEISRVSILATVVGKFISEDANYGTVTLDDGSETIRVKAFGPDVVKIKKARISDIVRFVGKVKQYENELYLSPEIIRKVTDPNWVIVQRIELGAPKKQEKKEIQVAKEVAEDVIKENDDTLTKKMMDFIRDNDKGDGTDVEKIIEHSELGPEEAKNILIGLLKSGELFEPRKGKLRVLD
jgi:RPA family protein